MLAQPRLLARRAGRRAARLRHRVRRVCREALDRAGQQPPLARDHAVRAAQRDARAHQLARLARCRLQRVEARGREQLRRHRAAPCVVPAASGRRRAA